MKRSKKWLSIDCFLNLLTSLTSWTAVLCVFGVIGFCGVEILGRWIFSFTTRGSEELTAFMLVGVTFMGLGYTFVQGGHISIDLIFKRLSPRWQKIMSIFNGITGVIFCAVVTYYSAKLVAQNIAFNSRSPSSWDVPLALPTSMIPIGVGMVGLLMLVHTIRLIRSLWLPDDETVMPQETHHV